jgi:predicted phage terminase large subunit-like protein
MNKLFQKMNMATTCITPNRDKVTRLMEYQGDFEQGNIYFNRDLTFNLVEQLMQFPDVEHDDLVDAMVYSFRKKKV